MDQKITVSKRVNPHAKGSDYHLYFEISENHDAESFALFLRQNRLSTLAFIERRYPKLDDPENVLGAATLKTLEAINRKKEKNKSLCKNYQSFKTWFTKICINQALSQLTSKQGNGQTVSYNNFAETEKDCEAILYAATMSNTDRNSKIFNNNAAHQTPLDVLAEKELRILELALLRILEDHELCETPDEKDELYSFKLRIVNNMSYDEIAQTRGIALSRIRKDIFNSQKDLQACGLSLIESWDVAQIVETTKFTKTRIERAIKTVGPIFKDALRKVLDDLETQYGQTAENQLFLSTWASPA